MTDTEAQATALTPPGEIHDLVSQLTLEEKVQLLTGRDFWSTWPIEKIGLRSIVFSDGPSGVRGPVWDERDPSLSLPSATALASSWDTDIARRYGAVAAVEARRKGVDVVLGPTINLHRSPYGGRHFEAFSEDPLLTGELAAAYVNGVQDNGVGATPKHYVANDSETERFTANMRIDEPALREVYLAAFEKAVMESRAWLIMSAYNSVNGATMTENDLLETPLNSEWGFDGVVISDWTAVRSIAAATASQDLAMPGPAGPWGEALVSAVRGGRVDESDIDRKAARILLLAARVGALTDHRAAEPVCVENGISFAREAAIEGTVLLENRGILPWPANRLSRIAVIGDNGRRYRSQGGGSATVIPEHTISPLEGLRSALPGVDIRYALGALVQDGIAEFPPETLTNPVTGSPGLRVRFLDAHGAEIFNEDRLASSLIWFGGDAPLDRAATVELHTIHTPADSEHVKLGFASVGHGKVYVDGQLVVDAVSVAVGTDLGAALLSPPSRSAEIELSAGVSVDVRLEFERATSDGVLEDYMSVRLGTEPAGVDGDALIAQAARAAAESDVALVVVGTSSAVESEGYDRSSLQLPGRQDELVAAVAAANPRSVVLVNAGSPVLMPWRDDVAAVLVGYFGGQEYGYAIADILLGVREPGGRLPTTWPAEEDPAVVLSTQPVNAELRYEEGIHLGYRRWLKDEQTPAYWFGYGRGYADIQVTDAIIPSHLDESGELAVDIGLRNLSERAGKQVVQIYASRPDSRVERPARWLVGFAPARVAGGAESRVTVRVNARRLAHWDAGWQLEAGGYEISVGTAAHQLAVHGFVAVEGGVR